ncbi:MAG: hypothetical protein AAF578_09930 [Pseudomonadota bacterium]
MTRMLVVAVLSLGTGVAGTLLFVGTPASDNERSVRDVEIASERSTSIATRETLRARPIPEALPDVYEIPSPVSRRLATYQLAAVSNPSELQDLIYEADRLANPAERNATLAVLFEHLAETDPRSAAQLAATELFVPDRELHNRVWAIWATADFEDALTNAAVLGGEIERRNAARALYLATEDIESPQAKRIEEVLGIVPDRLVRMRFIERMADRSLLDAVEFLNALPNGQSKQDYSAWLGYHLATVNPGAFDLLESSGLDRASKSVMRYTRTRIEAMGDPLAAVQMALSDPQALQNGEFMLAMKHYADRDPTAALEFVKSMEQGGSKNQALNAVLTAIGTEDPQRGLTLARQLQSETGDSRMVLGYLSNLTQSHPEFVLAQADVLKGREAKMLPMMVVNSLVYQNETERAVEVLESITNPSMRLSAERTLAQGWIRADPSAATAWLQTLPSDRADTLAQGVLGQLGSSDPDLALSLAAGFGATAQANIKHSIAGTLARNGAIDRALMIARSFEGTSESDKAYAAVVPGIASSRPDQALSLLGLITDPVIKQNTTVSVVRSIGRTEPARSLALAMELSDQGARSGLEQQVISDWYSSDSAAAKNWINQQSDEGSRDRFVAAAAGAMVRPTSEIAMLNRISDESVRANAFQSALSNVVLSEGISAGESFLKKAKLSEGEIERLREQMKQMTSDSARRFRRFM